MTGLQCTCQPQFVQRNRAERRRDKAHGRTVTHAEVHAKGCPLAALAASATQEPRVVDRTQRSRK